MGHPTAKSHKTDKHDKPKHSSKLHGKQHVDGKKGKV